MADRTDVLAGVANMLSVAHGELEELTADEFDLPEGDELALWKVIQRRAREVHDAAMGIVALDIMLQDGVLTDPEAQEPNTRWRARRIEREE